jgi:regulatory protein
VRRFDKPEHCVDPKVCRALALKLLARREHSRLELERKLLARSFERSTIEQTLDALEHSGALSTDRYTESFIRSRLAKGQGPTRVRYELASRGVGEDVADAAIADEQWDWLAAARRARVKRFGARSPQTYAERAKQSRFLEYRGFTAEQIRAALELGAETD